MFPPALALVWALWRQYRFFLLALLAYLATAATASAFLTWYGLWEAARSIVGVVMIAYFILATLLAVMFTFAHERADLIARESCYPPRLTRLPVATGLLAGWPLAMGAAAMISLWLVTARFLLQPWVPRWDGRVPLWWPGVLAAAGLAWVQALTWAPFGLRGVRLVLVAVILPLMISLAGWAADSGMPETGLVLLFTGVAATGWYVAFVGVRRARCGDVPDWGMLVRPFERLARFWPSRRSPFASAQKAQEWFEWRLHGNSLPIATALVLPAALLPLFFKNDILPPMTTVMSACFLPLLLASQFGARGGGNNPGAGTRPIGLGAFSATLPLSTAHMVAAMVKVAAASAALTWVLMALVVPLALWWTGTGQHVLASWEQWWGDVPRGQAIFATAMTALLLAIATWKRQVDRFYYGLHGRAWLAQLSLCVGLPLFLGLVGVIGWILQRPQVHGPVLAALPWILGPLALIRCFLAAWVLREQLQRGLLQPHIVARGLTAWMGAALVLFGSLAWAVPSERVPIEVIVFAVFFALPGVRLAAAPLVLAWNRHR